MSESDDIQRGLEMGSDEAVGPNQAQDGKKQTNPTSEIWKHYTRLPDDQNKAKCIYCCRVLACDSQKNVTKSWKMSRNSSKQNESEVDRMEHNKHIISELLLGKEGSFSTGVTKGDQGAQNNGQEGQGCKDSFPFFVEVISGLSKSDKERLTHALHEVVTFLNDDVDEILGHILAISKFGSEKLLPSHGSGSYEDGIAPPCAKRQKPVMVSLPDAYEKEHGHLSSDIFEQVTRDIQAIEESGETRQEAVKKFSTGLLGKLGKMAQGVVATKGIDDMSLKYFVEAGAIAVRRVRKEDLRHVAKATGATMVTTFADMEGEETFDSSFLGHADEVVEERIADDDVILVKGTKNTSAVSIILRGANDFMLDEIDRSLHDALCIVKRTLESNMVVAGGGAVEAALSVYLENLATTLGSREQLAIAEFAESLLIIPKVLSVNAAKDATELVAKLRAYHHTAQTKADKQHFSSMGLDLSKGIIRNNLEYGVIEPAMSKVKIIQFATEAAITILRIDDMIKLAKEESGNEE